MKQLLLSLLALLLPMAVLAETVEIDGICYNLIMKAHEAEVMSRPQQYAGSIVIPASVTYEGEAYSVKRIGSSAFNLCYALTSVTIPEGVTEIGTSAFRYCRGLASIAIPASMTTIELGAFDFCEGLTSVSITDLTAWCSITFLSQSSNPLSNGVKLYLNGQEVSHLAIPDGMTAVGPYAFSGCTSLTSVTIPSGVTAIGAGAFSGCTSLASVAIPSGVTEMGYDAFSGCTSLTSITIPSSVTKLESKLFGDCKNLASVTIPDGVTSIGEWTFVRCSSLTSLTLPASLEKISAYAFRDCSSLASLDIPLGVTSIGTGAFVGCTSLTSVTLPSGVASVQSSTFDGCSGLTSVNIPDGVTWIGELAFRECTSLPTVSVPNSVTHINQNAFLGCAKLTTVTLGSSMRSIERNAFASCTELTDVYCRAEKVPSASSSTFTDSFVEYATLHVPAASIEAYRAAEPWKNFKAIVALDGSETPETPKCATPTISYRDGKLTFSSTTEGVEFVSEITDSDIGKHHAAQVQLTATYRITVYATRAGYDNSDVATATLCWIAQQPEAEGIAEGLAQIPVRPVLIRADRGLITIDGAADGTPILLFTTDGTLAASTTSQGGTATLATHLPSGTAAIVRIGEKSVKVVVK